MPSSDGAIGRVLVPARPGPRIGSDRFVPGVEPEADTADPCDRFRGAGPALPNGSTFIGQHPPLTLVPGEAPRGKRRADEPSERRLAGEPAPASSSSSVEPDPSTPDPAPSIAPNASALPTPSAASTVERTEAALREAGLAGRFWRGDALSVSPLPSIPSGFRALDEQLPDGGWPARCLTELLLSQVGVGEIRFIATTLASLTQAGREIVLLGPPHIPDPTGWEQLGIDMRRVLVVRTERPADRLWALEQSLKSSAFGALIAWLPEEKALARHDVLRRLQLAAAAANGLTFLMRPAAAQYQSSPAPLRLTLGVGQPEGSRRTLSVRLLKRRGPVLAAPLTLALPEVHRGMKAFSRIAQENSQQNVRVGANAATSRSSASSPARTSPSMPATARLPSDPTTTRMRQSVLADGSHPPHPASSFRIASPLPLPSPSSSSSSSSSSSLLSLPAPSSAGASWAASSSPASPPSSPALSARSPLAPPPRTAEVVAHD